MSGGVTSTAVVHDNQQVVTSPRAPMSIGAMTIRAGPRIYFFELEGVGEPVAKKTYLFRQRRVKDST
jgi:hypothetical protein